MKKLFVRLVALALVAAMMVTGVPVAFASESGYTCSDFYDCSEDGTCYEVIKNNAPLREAAHNKGKVIARLNKGDLIRVQQVFKNDKGNTWCRVQYTDNSGNTCDAYIFSGNVSKHTNHDYEVVLQTSNGTLKICQVCAYAVAQSGFQSESCDLACVADQVVRGDYADNTSFWGIVGRIAVGFVPFVGALTDVRDLAYDATHDAPEWVLFVDLLAFAPVVGNLENLRYLKNLKYIDSVKYFDSVKNWDEVLQATRYLDVDENSTLTVVEYLIKNDALPDNYVTKAQAKEMGWQEGTLYSVDHYVPGYAIGGNVFKNNEGKLPKADGRIYYECDVDTIGTGLRGQRRIVFSNDGLIYFSDDHYSNFTLIYDGGK